MLAPSPANYLVLCGLLSVGCSDSAFDGVGNDDKSDKGGDTCVLDDECGAGLYCHDRICTAWAPAQQPHVTGEFTPPAWFGPDSTVDDHATGIFGMHAVLLRTGKVLLFSGHGFTNSLYAEESITWDPETDTSARQKYDQDIFCSHHTIMADGDVLISGGGALPNFSLAKRKTWRFDAVAERWNDAGAMAHERWYPTLLPLPDGRVLAASGQARPLPLEIFDPVAVNTDGSLRNEWKEVQGSQRALPELYPAMRILPTGQIYSPAVGWDFSEGAALLTLGKDGLGKDTATWTEVPRPDVLHEQGDTTFHVDDTVSPAGAVMRVFGGGVVDARGTTDTLPDGSTPEVKSVEEVNLTDPSGNLNWRPLANMNHVRSNVSAVLLPDGRIWAVGGQTGGEWNSDEDSSGEYVIKFVYETELYDPATDAWTLTKALVHPRQYHHTATLLPDGRVLVTAGQDPTKAGKLTGGKTRDVRSYEVFSPPYLFQEDGTPSVQPQVTQLPARVSYDQSFDVSISLAEGRRIEKVVMISPASETHHTDTGRFVSLKFASTSSGVNVQAPSTNTVATPGYYMLFLVDSAGVPSVGRFIQVAN